MLPAATIRHLLDRPCRHSKSFSQFPTGYYPRSPRPTDRPNSVIVQLGLRRLNPFRRTGTPLSSCVLHIVGSRTLEEMRRIAARWIIAAVTNINQWPGSRRNQKGYSVGVYPSATVAPKGEGSIRRPSLPFSQINPAAIVGGANAHFRPKAKNVLGLEFGRARINFRHRLKLDLSSFVRPVREIASPVRVALF